MRVSILPLAQDGDVQAYRGSQEGGGLSRVRRSPAQRWNATPGVSQITDVWQSTKQRQYEGEPMESQQFSPAAYSPNPTYYTPDDDFEDEDDHRHWQEYCRSAPTLDRTRILEVVLSDLDAEDSLLYEFIDDAIANSHEPGRPKESITKLARLGQSLLNLIARAVDDQVNLLMAVEEVPRD